MLPFLFHRRQWDINVKGYLKSEFENSKRDLAGVIERAKAEDAAAKQQTDASGIVGTGGAAASDNKKNQAQNQKKTLIAAEDGIITMGPDYMKRLSCQGCGTKFIQMSEVQKRVQGVAYTEYSKKDKEFLKKHYPFYVCNHIGNERFLCVKCAGDHLFDMTNKGYPHDLYFYTRHDALPEEARNTYIKSFLDRMFNSPNDETCEINKITWRALVRSNANKQPDIIMLRQVWADSFEFNYAYYPLDEELANDPLAMHLLYRSFANEGYAHMFNHVMALREKVEPDLSKQFVVGCQFEDGSVSYRVFVVRGLKGHKGETGVFITEKEQELINEQKRKISEEKKKLGEDLAPVKAETTAAQQQNVRTTEERLANVTKEKLDAIQKLAKEKKGEEAGLTTTIAMSENEKVFTQSEENGKVDDDNDEEDIPGLVVNSDKDEDEEEEDEEEETKKDQGPPPLLDNSPDVSDDEGEDDKEPLPKM